MTKPAIGAGLLLVGFFAAGLVVHGQDRPFLWNVVETGIRPIRRGSDLDSVRRKWSRAGAVPLSRRTHHHHRGGGV